MRRFPESVKPLTEPSLRLAISPLMKLTGWRHLLPVRRNLGVICFLYATTHALSYLVFNRVLDWRCIRTDIVERPFILLGVVSWSLLLPMALTSTNRAVASLGGPRWRVIHRAVYLVAVLVSVHFLLLVKVDVVTPIVYRSLVAGLLKWRAIRTRTG